MPSERAESRERPFYFQVPEENWSRFPEEESIPARIHKIKPGGK